ncbi:ATP-dependent RNA helicase vasa-like [Diabrotica virgifera virgifera]|uniref:RNA helicase n=2 Tax=Diabrotica virgifera virgifera TaxID=50390 RepID=A0ABM5K9E8_DIAVI|nr:ATP-dependent RNA helicase vasa-like [Diabrotica virgifera virgifera]
MDDDWDDDSGSAPAPTMAPSVATEGGKKFSAGRGFKSVEISDGDWNDNGGGDSWNNGGENGYSGGRGGGRRGGRGGGDRDGGYRGRGGDRRGGGGDRRGRGGFSRNGDSNGYGDENGGDSYGDSNKENYGGYENRGRGRGGGRGGRGGGRGDRGDDNDDYGGGGGGDKTDEPQKPREIYIPPERDEDLFTSTITSGINFVKLDDIEVNVSGENVPKPITSFESSGMRPHLLENIKKSGYTKPTPIQKYAVPIIMNGRDLMGCAQTGSGKTAAFLLPMINQLLTSQEGPVMDGNCCQPRVVIVSPTRELTIQIFEQAKKFAHNSIVKAVVAYGGASVSYQRNHVLAGCHILVATPGRLNDFVTRGHLSFASVQYFVLDEADRMLDMGFLPTVEQMLGHATMPATGERQTLMFSATFPEEIQHLAGKFLLNYVFVAVGIVGSASTDVEQVFYQVPGKEKIRKLKGMLSENGGERTVVFVEQKRTADFLGSFLSENGMKSTSIHGDRLQREREQALWDFKKGICNVLVATGVAARGLDIEGIEHVINFDLPKSKDEYVHRIGRTGRVGNKGKATSFFDSSSDSALAPALAVILKQAGQEVPDWFGDMSSQSSYHDSNSFGGTDIRGGEFGKAQVAEEADEEW